MAPLTIRGSLDKTNVCSDHYIKVSTQSSDSSYPWQTRPGFVTFVWNCDYRAIYGQTGVVSTYRPLRQTYDIQITIDESTVTFRDASGAGGDLSLPETIGTSGPLYVYVGADCDGCDAIWYSVEICSGLTTAPGYAPTPLPTTATYKPTTLRPTKHPTYEPSRAPSARPTVAPTATAGTRPKTSGASARTATVSSTRSIDAGVWPGSV